MTVGHPKTKATIAQRRCCRERKKENLAAEFRLALDRAGHVRPAR